MNGGDVRRLTAVDMHGVKGSPRRRSIIKAEFYVGVVGCIGLGIATLVLGNGGARPIGIWLIGIGLNYVPLALDAKDLSCPGRLEAELEGVDLRAEGRRAGVRQPWILVPLAVVVASRI